MQSSACRRCTDGLLMINLIDLKSIHELPILYLCYVQRVRSKNDVSHKTMSCWMNASHLVIWSRTWPTMLHRLCVCFKISNLSYPRYMYAIRMPQGRPAFCVYFTRVLHVCHSYARKWARFSLVCYTYVTRILENGRVFHSYVTRMLLVY